VERDRAIAGKGEGSMKTKATAKSVLIMFVIGTLVSAQQASAESVFTPKGFDSIEAYAVSRPMPPSLPAPASGPGALGMRSFSADTVETFDVQIEEDKGPGMGKQLAVFAIITAIVGYAVIELMATDDEPATPKKPPGKEVPTFVAAWGISAGITR
jgi:hypothetical protein